MSDKFLSSSYSFGPIFRPQTTNLVAMGSNHHSSNNTVGTISSNHRSKVDTRRSNRLVSEDLLHNRGTVSLHNSSSSSSSMDNRWEQEEVVLVHLSTPTLRLVPPRRPLAETNR